MSENVQEIIDELIQKYEEGELTLQDIDEAVARCSLIDPKATDNAVTVLYSGGEDAIAESLAASKMNIRIINRTEAYDLLTYNKNGRSFNEFVRQAVNNENPSLYGDALKEAVNQKLYGTSKPGSGVSEVGEGYWSKISSQFASETKGDVYALVTDARADRIFRLEELKQALNVMADNKTINGCSKAELGKLSIDKIFETVKGKAIEDFADEMVYVNEYGEKVGGTLTNKFLKENYYFNIGDGSDLIFDCEDGEIKKNDARIVFGKGIRAEDVQMERVGYNFEIRYSEQDKVTIQDAYRYDDGRSQIESIVFKDNSVYKIDYENIGIQEKE